MSEGKKKIAICGLIGSENIGEQFISQSLAWIIMDVLKEYGKDDNVEIFEFDLEGRNTILKEYTGFLDNRKKNYYDYKVMGFPFEAFYVFLKRVLNRLHNKTYRNMISRLRHLMWKHGRNLERRLTSFYERKLTGCDLLVIDGAGLLEYSRNEYYEPLLSICKFANKYNIPVVFNAIGQSGEFDPLDYRCKLMKSIFQLECVKYVSARDSVDIVKGCVGSRFSVKQLADAAFCINVAFGKAKTDYADTIGIGLIRGDSLQSYNVDFYEEDWIKLFCDIAKALDEKGKKFKFFTNGMVADYELGLKIIKRLGLDESCLEARPRNAIELLDTIRSFQGLITCRMHSSIAAFALGIPSIILSWNNKVNKYMDLVGYPERAIDIQNFNAEYILASYEHALIEGVSKEKQYSMKKKARESVTDYLPRLLYDEQYK